MKSIGRLPGVTWSACEGRPSHPLPEAGKRNRIRPRLRHVPLDKDGKDSGGCYWPDAGPDQPLVFAIQWDEGRWEGTVGNLRVSHIRRTHYIRAVDEWAAKRTALQLFPAAAAYF